MKNIDTIFFKATDGVNLNGILYKSEKQTKKVLISIHGMVTNCLKPRDEIIAKKVNIANIDLLTFNNRGHDIVSYIKKDNILEHELGGTAYEEISECYEDILGAINYLLENKYDEIYLMGHSLGSTKSVYFYNKLLNENNDLISKIKAVILLSLVDIPFAMQIYLKEKFQSMVTYAKNMKKEKMENILMPEESFIHPISVKTFLRYALENDDMNFARYTDKEYDFKELNNIKVPLFMRWGNVGELIIQDADKLCDFLKTKINNPNLNIGYIDRADHSYTGKEETLAEEILKFLEESVNGDGSL